MGVLVLAFVIWAFIARWPTIVLTVGFGLAAVLLKRHRRVLGWASASSFAFMLLVVSVNPAPQSGAGQPEATGPATAGSPSSAVRPADPPAEAPAVTAATTGERRTITKIIDGDTFAIDGGQKVRVLGIDSCEANTPGGKEATEAAKYVLSVGGVVTLLQEPGVDKDKHGRLMRYVTQPNGLDYGEYIIVGAHTGVYEGKNDASAERLARLRQQDQFDGRNCSGTPAPSYNEYDNNGGGDGNDGESRFCRKRRWC